MKRLRSIVDTAAAVVFIALALSHVEAVALEVGIVSGVGDSWTTVSLNQGYTSMVVVATPNYDNTSGPGVVRIRNATDTSFELRVDPAGAAVPSNIDVHYMVVEEGTYTVATDGVEMEAVKYLSTVTDSDSSWVGENRSYANSYTNPVVLGQVMTYNDTDFCTFWCYGSAAANPPDTSNLNVGKTVCEDSVVTRADETVGYLVIEAGSGTIDGITYSAGVGADTVQGVGDSPPYSYSLTGLTSPPLAVASVSAMDGGNGGWVMLYGANPVTATTLNLAIDEDQVMDPDRNHTTEQVGYIVFEDIPPKFITAPVISVDEDTPYSYNITTTDLDGDTPTLTAPTLPTWLTLTDNGDGTGTLTGTPTNDEVGDHEVIIEANDGNGGITQQPFTITANNVNDDPVFTSTPVTSADEDSAYSYAITTSDDDGDTPALTAPTLPGWLTLTDNGDGTGALTGTPTNDDVGDHDVILEANDGNGGITQQPFTITVNNTNDAPSFTSTPIVAVNEDTSYTYIITTADDDGDTPALTALTLPTWLTLTDNGDGTGSVTGTPANDDVGLNSVTLEADDGNGGVTQQPFTITVNNTNDAPSFTSTPVTSADEDSAYSYAITTSDDDGDTPALIAPTLPGWLTLTDNGDGTAALTGTPTNDDVGDHDVIIEANDGNGGITQQPFTITVNNTNDAPSFTSTPIAAVNEDAPYMYIITTADDDGDTPALTAPTLPTWLTLTDNGDRTGSLSGTPTNDEVGDHNVILEANDGNGGITQQPFTITVNNTNDTPSFTSTPVTAVEEDQPYVYNITTNDIDGDTPAVTALTLSTWLTLTDNGDGTGTLTGTPPNNEVGNHNVVLEADDGNGGTVQQPFTVTVSNTNDAPSFTSTPVTSADEDAAYTYNITTTDADDADTPAITAPTLPGWLTLTDNNDGTGTLSGTPTNDEVGNHDVVLEADDGNGAPVQQPFRIAVNNTNDAPSFTSTPVTTVEANDPYVYAITASDPDDDTPVITAPTLPGWVTMTDNGDGTGTLTGAPINDHVGAHNVVLEADDGNAGITRQAFTIDVILSFVVVDTLDDADNGDLSPGDVSLREALLTVTSGGTVTFAPDLTGTIALDDTLGQLVVDKDLTLSGPRADRLTVSGGGTLRVLWIGPEVTVDIRGLSIADGNAGDGDGGGILNHGTLTLTNCTLCENEALEGGGLADFGSVTLTNNTISGNWATYGGGLSGCDGTIQNNIIAGNSAAENGGGLHDCYGIIQNNTIYGNSAEGDGGGLYECSGEITNCIIWENAASYGAQLSDCVTPSYSCIQDWTDGGIGNISDDPFLADPGNADFHLDFDSPCIDAGSHTNGLTEDFEGELRGYDGSMEPRGDSSDFDIGADEYVEYLDTDEDGLPDRVETGTDLYVDETDTGTDPVNPDTDGDGMPDGWEVDNTLDPLIDDSSADADGDGLDNLDEFAAGTDPNHADTDGDGLNDEEEVGSYLTDPLEADTDGDGYADSTEVARGSDPLDPTSCPRSRGGAGRPCFIATAAYGTSAAEEVRILQQFRDKHLLTNRAGTACVRIYYRFSPPVARFISTCKPARAVARFALALIAGLARLFLSLPVCIAAALLLGGTAIAAWRFDRKTRPAYHLPPLP